MNEPVEKKTRTKKIETLPDDLIQYSDVITLRRIKDGAIEVNVNDSDPVEYFKIHNIIHQGTEYKDIGIAHDYTYMRLRKGEQRSYVIGQITD